MKLAELFSKWNLNHNHFARLLNMSKGTFNNKLNPMQRGKFKDEELLILRIKLKEMINDIESYVYTYPEQEEDLKGDVDETQTYNGRSSL